MAGSVAAVTSRLLDRTSRDLLEGASVDPGRFGLGVAIAWLSFVVVAHAFAVSVFGPAPLPFGTMGYAWTILVNAGLLGLVAGGQKSLSRGVVEDFKELQALLPASHAALEDLVRDATNLSCRVRWTVTVAGMLCGLFVATLDPILREFYRPFSLLDPRYVVFVSQNLIFATLLSRLFMTEIHMTRAYARLGAQVHVDLLEPSTLLVFGRKGLRSVILWVSISTLFSMFWVLDSAGQANVVLSVAVLGLATAALIAPTSGVRRSIALAKSEELTTVGAAIRRERDAALSRRSPGAPPDDSRLGNLLQYQSFVKSVREWPFDLSIVSRSSLFILLGAGSWFGGAIVERLVNHLLD